MSELKVCSPIHTELQHTLATSSRVSCFNSLVAMEGSRRVQGNINSGGTPKRSSIMGGAPWEACDSAAEAAELGWLARI